jgi:type VI secretion system protein VasD
MMRRIVLLAIGLVFFSGCAKSPDVKADLSLQAAHYLNPDLNGRASPLMVTFYELKTPLGYKDAEFFDLENNAEQILQDNLVDKQTIEMRPSESKHYVLRLPRDVRYVGVSAGYRNIDQAKWRSILVVPENKDEFSARIDLQSEELKVQLIKDEGGFL